MIIHVFSFSVCAFSLSAAYESCVLLANIASAGAAGTDPPGVCVMSIKFHWLQRPLGLLISYELGKYLEL